MVRGVFAAIECESSAPPKEVGSRIDDRPEIVSEGGLLFEVVKARCRILDLAINREMKLGRGGGTSSSSFPIGTESAGIYCLSSVSARLIHDHKNLLSHI